MPTLTFQAWAELAHGWTDMSYGGDDCTCVTCAGYRAYRDGTETEEATMPTVYTPNEATIARWRQYGIPTTDEESERQREEAYAGTLTAQFRYHAREAIRVNGYGPGGAQHPGAVVPFVRTIGRAWIEERARRGRRTDNVALVMYNTQGDPLRMLCSAACITGSRVYDDFLLAVTADTERDSAQYARSTFAHPNWRVMGRGSSLHRAALAALDGQDCYHCAGPLDPNAPRRDYCDSCGDRRVLNYDRLCENCVRNMRDLADLCLGCGDLAHDPQPWCSGVNAVRIEEPMLALAGAITRAAGQDPQQTVLWSEVELAQHAGQGDLYGPVCPDCDERITCECGECHC